MSSPKQVVDLLTIVQGENVLTAGMDKILIYVVHDIIQNDVPNT